MGIVVAKLMVITTALCQRGKLTQLWAQLTDDDEDNFDERVILQMMMSSSTPPRLIFLGAVSSLFCLFSHHMW